MILLKSTIIHTIVQLNEAKRCWGWFFAAYKEKSNKKDPKFKINDHVRISKYKIIFAKGYSTNWSEEIFVVKKILYLGDMKLVI